MTLVVQPLLDVKQSVPKGGTQAFTTHIDSGGESKEVLIKMHKMSGEKPFLGGYRHKNTGVEYHHASAQTLPKLQYKDVSRANHNS